MSLRRASVPEQATNQDMYTCDHTYYNERRAAYGFVEIDDVVNGRRKWTGGNWVIIKQALVLPRIECVTKPEGFSFFTYRNLADTWSDHDGWTF